jgi:hypothetical protein
MAGRRFLRADRRIVSSSSRLPEAHELQDNDDNDDHADDIKDAVVHKWNAGLRLTFANQSKAPRKVAA